LFTPLSSTTKCNHWISATTTAAHSCHQKTPHHPDLHQTVVHEDGLTRSHNWTNCCLFKGIKSLVWIAFFPLFPHDKGCHSRLATFGALGRTTRWNGDACLTPLFGFGDRIPCPC
jgi:hypothetical protein